MGIFIKESTKQTKKPSNQQKQKTPTNIHDN